MLRVALTLLSSALVAYVGLPYIKPMGYWKSTIIFFCIVFIFVVLEWMKSKGQEDQNMTAVRQAVQGSAATVAMTAKAQDMASAISGVMQEATAAQAPESVAPNTSRPTGSNARPAAKRSAAPHLIKPAADRGTLEHLMFSEIEAINRTLEAHRIDARAYFLPTKNEPTPYIATPSFFAYKLVRKPGQKIDAITKLNLELSAAITDCRNRIGIAGNYLVRISEFPTAIETPRPNPLPLVYGVQHLPPMVASIGRVYDFDGAHDVKINLATDFHALFAGMSGYGKSNAMRVGLTSLIQSNPGDRIKFLLADLKGKDLGIFADLPNVLGYTNTAAGADKMISKAIEMMEMRQGMKTYPYRLVFAIDELAEVSKDMRPQISRLLNLGRDMEINVWGGTQYPTAKEIGENIPQGFTIRLVTRVAESISARFVAGVPGSAAEQIETPGDFLLVRSGRVSRLRTFELSRSENARLIGQVEATAQPEVEQPTATVSTTSANTPNTSNVPAGVAAVFKEYFNDETGDLARGGKAEAKRTLFGEKNVAKSGRKASEQAETIDKHFLAWKKENGKA